MNYRTKKGKIINSVSLNYGYLETSLRIVIASMASIRWLSKNKYKWLYTSGGSFRALGLVTSEEKNIRLGCHGTKIGKALKFAVILYTKNPPCWCARCT